MHKQQEATTFNDFTATQETFEGIADALRQAPDCYRRHHSSGRLRRERAATPCFPILWHDYRET